MRVQRLGTDGCRKLFLVALCLSLGGACHHSRCATRVEGGRVCSRGSCQPHYHQPPFDANRLSPNYVGRTDYDDDFFVALRKVDRVCLCRFFLALV
jgi:hypothetical protein